MNKFFNILYKQIHIPILLGIVYIAIWTRLSTAGFDVILDYDPYWFYRHAQNILNNNFIPPKWDLLSYYPPGRPVDFYLGWSYTLAAFYLLAKNFITINFMRFAGLFVAVFAGFTAIPAYFVGKHVTNRWGGLFTAFFASITPTFLSVSMAGYSDSDSVDVFYTFLAIITTLYAIKKSEKLNFTNFKSFYKSLINYLPYLLPALISYWLFAFNWSSSWYIYYIFLGFVPLLIVFRIIESIVQRKEKIIFPNFFINKIKENKNLAFSLILIGLLGEAITLTTYRWPFNTSPPHQQLVEGLNIIRGESMIVFISVAELQPINVFSQEGFFAVVNRVGWVPVVFAFTAFLITATKLIFKREIHLAEYFAIIWLIISLWLITRGVRFSLLFSMAVATAAGFTIGNLIEFVKLKKSSFIFSTIFALLVFASIWHLSDNIQFSFGMGGMEISQNWKDAMNWLKQNADKDALITTWWDPGHIIAGYTGLKVHADGAHCGPHSCLPYDHNTRIQDMGRIFSTNSEEEAVRIMKKYMSLSSEQCQEVKKTFGDKVPSEACKDVTEMYIIASSDLIGKYYWLSYFGTGTGRNFAQFPFSYQDAQGSLVYGGGIITLTTMDNQVVALLNIPQQGIRNAFIKDVVIYQNNQEMKFQANVTNIIDGMLWVDPSFRTVIFMQSEVRDSLFTKMFFFNGKGLEHLELKYNNPELKIYKVKF